MLGYSANSNAIPRGCTLMKKYKHLFHGLFISIYVGLHIMIQANIQVNINKHKCTKNTHSQIYTPTNK